MLDLLDDSATPEFAGEFRAGVDRCVERRRRRTRAVAGGAGALSIAVGAVLLTQLPGGGADTVVDTAVASTSAPTTVEVATTLDVVIPSTAAAPVPTTVAATRPVLLGDRDETLSRDEWLTPTQLPDGFIEQGGSIQYELVRNELGEPVGDGRIESAYRSVGFALVGAESAAGRFDVEIFDVPSARPPIVNASPEWIIEGFTANRRVGSSQVFVYSSPEAMSADEFRTAIGSLAITSLLSFDATILDRYGPDAVELAAAEFAGERFEVAVQNRNIDGLDCFFFGRVVTSGYGCSDPLSFDGVMNWSSNTGLLPGTSTQEIQAYGTVGDDVATVDVELMDGSVRTLEPQPAIGDYPHRVWIVATSVQVDTTVNPLTLGPAVRSVTAFDSNGDVLADDRRCC